jgi:hypothetical protein
MTSSRFDPGGSDRNTEPQRDGITDGILPP